MRYSDDKIDLIDTIILTDSHLTAKEILAKHQLDCSESYISKRKKSLGLRSDDGKYGQNSVDHFEYPGPAGWTVDDGPPCKKCQYHKSKMVGLVIFGVRQLRKECLKCSARNKWADHNDNGLMVHLGYSQMYVAVRHNVARVIE